MREYSQPHCWQYDIRVNNAVKDIEDALHQGLTKQELNDLQISDFTMQYEQNSFKEASVFINKHEWLGKMGLYPTHIFTARYKNVLAGVVTMDMPNAFCNLLGKDTKYLERLIGRGACISWSPKNLASSLIMFAIRWMVSNTPYRLFTAYSDPEAKELGTIYQACNFYYLGQNSGTKYKYLVNGRWVTDRSFRSRSMYKRLAKQLNIIWNRDWQSGDKVLFDRMPDDIVKKLKDASKQLQISCPKKLQPLKHKYAYILGADRRETKKLKKIFEKNCPPRPYPKIRGAQGGFESAGTEEPPSDSTGT